MKNTSRLIGYYSEAVSDGFRVDLTPPVFNTPLELQPYGSVYPNTLVNYKRVCFTDQFPEREHLHPPPEKNSCI